MKEINFKRVVNGNMEEVVQRVTDALKTEGFGVLTRIDFHGKIKEKLGKELDPVIVLGACNPQLAYQAYLRNSDVASLIPCNAVVRSVNGAWSVELMKPTAMMETLGDADLVAMAQDADARLKRALERI